MALPAPDPLLCPGLLDGLDVLVAGGDAALERHLAGIGADVHTLEADLLDESAVGAAVGAATEHATALVVCAGSAFAAGGLRACTEGAWNATRAVLTQRLRPTGFGKVVLLAPAPDAGPDAAAARAALESLARTTAVEWARLGVRVVALRPGPTSSPDAVASIVAFLLSPAGDYVSGCVLDLGAAGQPAGSS